MVFNRRNSPATPIRMPTTRTIASQGTRAKVDVTTRNSLMKMPSGGSPAMATTPSTKPQPSTGLISVRPPNLGNMTDREEDCRFRQRMHGHVQEAGEVRKRATHAEGKGDDAHMLDRRIGEHALDVAAAVQHERRENERDEPH